VTGFSEADSATAHPAVVRYLQERAGCEVVSAKVEGRPVLLAFEPDPYEHPRRRHNSLATVPSRRLLHALWSLPHQIPWPACGLDQLDIETLESDGAGFVAVDHGTFVRIYQPPGRVHAVAMRSRRLTDAVNRVGQFPPIFSRYAIATRSCGSDHEAVVAAAALGIGTAMAHSGGLQVRSEPATPQRGVPGVYRWWLAELAYREWRQASAH
jgi:hypothetical protein